MLKIIMGSEYADQYIPKDKEFIEFPNSYFDDFKKVEWFEETFVKRVIEEIDKAYVELGFSVRSIETGEGYSVNDLSGGSKFLILAYKLRQKVFRITMGDNCTDFLEYIAADYEKEGRDLVVVSNYTYNFNFKYINNIQFINYNVVCSKDDNIYKLVYDKWLNKSRVKEPEQTPEEEEAELIYLASLLN